jgi:hypothetical protein
MGRPLRACIVLVFLLACVPFVCAQAGAGTLKATGQVSGAVAVSAPEAGAAGEGARVSTETIDGATVAVTISGSGSGVARVRIPVHVRSNVGYSLRASFLSADELTARLSVAEVRATGKFVRAGAAEGAERPEASPAHSLTARNPSPPVVILSGPPVSKAGTLGSPGNALEVVLSVEIGPRADAAARSTRSTWSTRLIVSAAPVR